MEFCEGNNFFRYDVETTGFSLKKASKGSTPESELKLAAQAECVTFFKYFVDYGLSWPDYKKLDKWSRQSVGQKYIQRMAA